MEKMERKKIKVAMLLPDDRSGKNLPEPFFGSAATALLQGFEMLGSDVIEVHIISCVIGELPAPEKLADNIWYHQIVIPKWTFLRSLHLGPIIAVRRKLRKIQPDLVHSQGTEKWCAITGCLSGYPAVLTIHGHLRMILKTTPMKPYSYWYLQMMLGEIAIRLHKGVICISKHIRESVTGQAKRSWIIPNALRNKFLVPVHLRNYDCIKILVIGTIVENKRTLEILNTFDRLFKKGLVFKATFYGQLSEEGDYQKEFAKAINQASDLGYASYGGMLNHQEIIKEMDASHALVHFPLEEAFGLVVAESLARGLKVFASDVGGIKDITANIYDAKTFNKYDMNGLENSLMNWIKNGILSYSDSHKTMKIKYSPEIVAHNHINVYSDVINDAKTCQKAVR
jgi:glycosyltransferase involved in cell wall biosynthesis